jgi:hypothetical protein
MSSWRLVIAVLALGVAGGSLAAAEPAKVEIKGPLAGLPSKPGLHIEQIKALGDNQWLKLPPAVGDPQFNPPRQGTVRTWSPKSCYDAALGGAIMTGEGAHGWIYKTGHYSDDVVFYDLYANRWIFVYPGTHLPTLKQKMESGEYKVDEKQLGVLVDKDGRPLPIAPMSGHGGSYQSYDPAARKFVFFGTTFTYFFPKEPIALFQEKRKEKGLAPNSDCTFWIYDAAADRFQPVSKSQLGAPNAQEVHRLGGRQVIQYVDSKKMHFWSGDKADYWLDLAEMKMTVRPIAKGEPRLQFNGNSSTGSGGGGCNACYDPKRDRVYMGGTTRVDRAHLASPGDNFLYYDVKADKWVKPDPKGKFPLTWDIAEAFVYYDTIQDRLVIIGANQHWTKKEDRFVYVYDPDKNEFAEPIPVSPDFPLGLGHSFFCPDLNAFFIQAAGGDNRVADTWVYRYKRAPEKK